MDGGEWSTLCTVRFTHGNEHLYSSGWAPEPVWTFRRWEKSLPSIGIRTPDHPYSATRLPLPSSIILLSSSTKILYAFLFYLLALNLPPWFNHPSIYTGHAPDRWHLYAMGLFDGDPICRFCGMETETVQHIIFCCEVMTRQCYNAFGRPTVEPKDICTASVRDLCLFIEGAGLLRLCWTKY